MEPNNCRFCGQEEQLGVACCSEKYGFVLGYMKGRQDGIRDGRVGMAEEVAEKYAAVLRGNASQEDFCGWVIHCTKEPENV